MSAAAVSYQPSLHFNWAHEQSRQEQAFAEVQHHSRGSQVPIGTRDWFNPRLPSPLSTQTMTGTTLGYGGSQTGRPQGYQNGQTNSYSVPSAKSLSYQQDGNTGYSGISISNGQDDFSADIGGPDGVSLPSKPRIDAIATHLQIPKSVNKSKGSLAEFAAEVC